MTVDARQEWEAERDQVIRMQRIAREEAAELRRFAEAQAERQASRDAVWDAAQRTGQPVPSVADILARSRDLPWEGDTAQRDMSRPYGHPARPALYATTADGSLIEIGEPGRGSRPADAVSAGVAAQMRRAADAHDRGMATLMRIDPEGTMAWARRTSSRGQAGW